MGIPNLKVPRFTLVLGTLPWCFGALPWFVAFYLGFWDLGLIFLIRKVLTIGMPTRTGLFFLSFFFFFFPLCRNFHYGKCLDLPWHFALVFWRFTLVCGGVPYFTLAVSPR